MRLDRYLVDQSIVETRSKASDLIQRGKVLVNDVVILKNGYEIEAGIDKVVVTKIDEYVSRSGNKLEQAINFFNISFKNLEVIDVGSSTGGFTDCAIKHGAKKVYAYDVGSNQIAESLKNNSKIEIHEETNILDVNLKLVDIVLVDVSFTSVIPIINHISSSGNEFIFLIKPQFETMNKHLKNGILRDKKIHIEILKKVIECCTINNLKINGIVKTELKGKTGNQEYLLFANKKNAVINNISSLNLKEIVT